ncbi:cupin [Paenibacillus antri]|uniref:Cupin n=1 Tax=Paenibacillus antri TaxID=2582848 RepID=A0A5R9GHZ6_9BACL|nr:cupin [Paenibacillus antri]TLS51125.1 cupin [Paenibacillus antri]
MELYRFDRGVSKPIHAFNSLQASITPIIRSEQSFQVGCIHLGEEGVIGYHQATTPQLFLVIQGEGFVTGEDRIQVPIKSGQAAFWTEGEWHESGSKTGMTVVIIESSQLDPNQFMKHL